MESNFLLSPLPYSVETSVGVLDIDPDWRIMAALEVLLTESETSDDEQAAFLLLQFMPSAAQLPPDELEEILKWFYKCGEADSEGKEADEENDEDENYSDERVYSFEYDAAAIYAAFMQAYGINLAHEALHWWEFRALFNALPADCHFMKIIGYRTAEITSDMSDREKEHYRRMKRRYALPMPQSEQEKLDKITEALLNGGDLSGVL